MLVDPMTLLAARVALRRSSRVFLMVLAGCAHAPVSAPPASPEPAEAAPAASPAVATRELAESATYADLVRSAGLLDGVDAPNACLLAREAGAFRLAAEVRGGLRPLPAPAAELDDLLQSGTTVQVLTPWGRYGDARAPLALASLTAFPPAPRALALLLTDRGVSVRGVTESAQTGTVSPDNLATLGSLDGVAVFVTAEAQVSVEQLYELLEELTRLRANVALAVDLATVASLPAAAAPAQVARCPDGLPETAALGGDLSRDALLAGLSPLQEHAPACLTQGASAAGAAGGKLVLGLRIDERGAVSETCVVADQLGDSGVAACVLNLARGLRFEPPSPPGLVDVELPLLLRPHSSPAQAAVCAVTD
jgi:hypothetical protein